MKEQGIMTPEEVDKIERYANGVWYRSRGSIGVRDDSFEDFKQKMLMYALQYPGLSGAQLMAKIRLNEMCLSEDLPYKLSEMKKFCELAPIGTDDVNGYIERVYGLGAEDKREEEDSCVFELSEKLYDREDLKECFIDYMFGQSVDGNRAYKSRVKLFNHRFEVLEFLKERGKLTESKYLYYLNLAKSMTRVAPVPKVLSMSYYAVDCRKRYYENLEKSRERVRNNARKKRELKKNEGIH